MELRTLCNGFYNYVVIWLVIINKWSPLSTYCCGFVKLQALINKQECIPVGCVPAARWPYAGVCSRGVSAPGRVSAPGGVSAPRGCLLWGGVCSRGVGVCLGGGGGVPVIIEFDNNSLWGYPPKTQYKRNWILSEIWLLKYGAKFAVPFKYNLCRLKNIITQHCQMRSVASCIVLKFV